MRALALLAEEEAVGDRDKDDGDPFVAVDFGIEGTNSGGRVIGFAGVGNRSVPEDVINGDESAGMEEGKSAFVIVVVVGFVSINEGEVEGAGLTVCNEGIEGLDGGAGATDNFVAHVGGAPVSPGLGKIVFRKVEGEELAIFRKGEGSGQGGISRKGTNLKGFARVGEADEHLHERALFRGDLHNGVVS